MTLAAWRIHWPVLIAGLTLVGLLVRLAVMASPLGELDADEAVVGLMARNIAFQGERPVFYYGQAYLGSLEAFTAAPLFLAFDSSSFLLKLVPLAYSLGFLVLSAVLARRLFGDGPALLTAAYLALPPAMWAVWSIKARGGYAEMMFLGEALLLISLWLSEARRSCRASWLWGLVAGLAVWTHLLALVYVVAAAVFIVARRRRWSPGELASAAVGVVVGAAPLLIANLADGFATSGVVSGPTGISVDPVGESLRFVRVGLPMLLGVGRPVPPPTLALDLDWSAPTAGPLFVVAPLVLALGGVLAWHARALLHLARRTPGQASEPAILLLLALVTTAALALTSYGYFESEPRYALPLYSAVPLLANAVWHLPRMVRPVAVGGILILHTWNIGATAVQIGRPEGAIDTTPENRIQLVDFLTSHDRHQMYTEYWIAYTTMFETRQTVLAAVVAGGPNRYLPAADNVARTPNAAWVFLRSSDSDRQFQRRLAEVGATAEMSVVSSYDIYLNVRPLEPILVAY